MKRFLTLSLLTACGAIPKQGEPLMDSVQLYNEGVRWERLANAASRVPAAERSDFLDEREELLNDRLAAGERVREDGVLDRRRAPHYLDFLELGQVVENDLEHEAIELRFRQRVGPLELDRILGGEHVEGRVERVGAPDHLVALDVDTKGLETVHVVLDDLGGPPEVREGIREHSPGQV